MFYIIEQNELMRLGWESYLKEVAVDCYSCDSVGDFQYIAEDLKPDVFLCDGKTIRGELDHFINTITTSPILKQIPLVIMGDKIKLDRSGLYLSKPLELETAYQEISSYLQGLEK